MPFATDTDAFGAKPHVPLPTTTAPGAITGNIANLGNLYGLARATDAFNVGQAPLSLRSNLPNYDAMLAKSSANILSNLKGQVPRDVVTQILQNAAERGIMTGGAGSANSNAAMLRALGLTSLGLQQAGEQELTGAIARTPQVKPFDISSMFVSPGEQQSAAAANAIYAAAPDPAAAAAARMAATQSGLSAGRGSISAPALQPAPGQSPLAWQNAWNSQFSNFLDDTYTGDGTTAFTVPGAPAYSDQLTSFYNQPIDDWAYETLYGDQVPAGTQYDAGTDTMYMDTGE